MARNDAERRSPMNNGRQAMRDLVLALALGATLLAAVTRDRDLNPIRLSVESAGPGVFAR